MTFKEQVQTLNGLTPAARVAFCARSAERALAELERLRPDEYAAHAELRYALDALWSQAAASAPTFTPEMPALHDAVGRFIPETEDDPEPDKALRYTAQALALGLSALRFPDRAAHLAALAGGAMRSLVGTVYGDTRAVQSAEERWQDAALTRLAALPPGPIGRESLADLPEYDRGAISADYADGTVY